MTNKTKITFAAALIAAFATPALAQAQSSVNNGRYNGHVRSNTQEQPQEQPYATQQRLFESRNAAPDRYREPLVPNRDNVLGN